MAEWAAFEYREFYDYPRIAVVERDGIRYLLDCPFDYAADDYPEEYQICRLKDGRLPAGSWIGLGAEAEPLGSIGVSPRLFDETRRALIRWDLVRAAIQGQ
ncbi:MAG: hypothetical protein LBI84_09595 [Propionibacteriaceae bacterium]|jgi:hypothetical protein|nr:hypothetical protein [Propionibacteriaceae bacterium]